MGMRPLIREMRELLCGGGPDGFDFRRRLWYINAFGPVEYVNQANTNMLSRICLPDPIITAGRNHGKHR